MVWRLDTGERLQDLSVAADGPISSICWIETGELGPNRVFVFGCADGVLHVYRKTEVAVSRSNSVHTSRPDYLQAPFTFHFSMASHSSCLQDIVFDPHHQRLATCGHHGEFIVYQILGQGKVRFRD